MRVTCCGRWSTSSYPFQHAELIIITSLAGMVFVPDHGGLPMSPELIDLV